MDVAGWPAISYPISVAPGEVAVMTLRTVASLIACATLAAAAPCFAQALDDFPDSALTAEQWQQRVQDARRRSELFVAKARAQPSDPASADKEEAEAADQRAMNDPNLRKGDIIATSRGLFVFNGDDGNERRPSSFSPPRNPTQRPR